MKLTSALNKVFIPMQLGSVPFNCGGCGRRIGTHSTECVGWCGRPECLQKALDTAVLNSDHKRTV